MKHYMVVKKEGLFADTSVGLNYNTHTGTVVQVEVQMMSQCSELGALQAWPSKTM